MPTLLIFVARRFAQMRDQLDRIARPARGAAEDRGFLACTRPDDTWGWSWLNPIALQEEDELRAVQLHMHATYMEIEKGGVPLCSMN